MEEKLSEVLDNILGLLLLEGSYDIEEEEEFVKVSIDTPDAGRLIGARGESLDSLQLLVNQIMTQKLGSAEQNFKRVIFDVGGWRKQKEEDLAVLAKKWAEEVLASKKEMELEPQAAWQRRIIHEVVGELDGVETESIGEGRDRHIVIKLKTPAKGEARQRRQMLKVKTKKSAETDVESRKES